MKQSRVEYQKERHKKRYADPAKRAKILAQSNAWGHTIHGRFSTYKSNAKTKHRVFLLSFDDFCKIAHQPCFYCGKTDVKYNGVDRVNSSEGYTKENCVPCCSVCNKMKSNLSVSVFIKQCTQIATQKDSTEKDHYESGKGQATLEESAK